MQLRSKIAKRRSGLDREPLGLLDQVNVRFVRSRFDSRHSASGQLLLFRARASHLGRPKHFLKAVICGSALPQIRRSFESLPDRQPCKITIDVNTF